jgi:hypothetical protein
MSRKFLATAALAPLLICGGKAVAETQVTSSSRTTPVATSTASSGAADDVKITSDGAITLSASGAIATLDSDNTLTNNGSLLSVGVDDSIGVLVLGGRTGTLLNSATISITEDYDYTDDDSDGDYDGLFAKGSGRYGIRLTGTDPFVGTITNDSSGAITIEGNDSAGISLEAPLTGSLLHAGSISVVGDRGYGIHTTGAISGSLTSTGSISVIGAGSVGLAVDADVGGVVALQGSIYSTGYRATSRYTDPDDEALLDADDLLQGGGGVKVTANVAGGVLLDAPPTDTNDDTTDDEDGDGTADGSEGTASITAYGSAPALLIGSDTRSVTLGAVGTGDDAYGLIIKGSVTAGGIHDGIDATALQLGGDAGQDTIITGGVKLSGSLSASAYEGNAVALKLNAGAVADTLWNTGSISASIAGDTAVTAKAVSIGAGAVMTSITNAGAISASVAGEGGSAFAIVDETGGLKTITNTGSIAAYVYATDDDYDTDDDDTDATNETLMGVATAIDVSKNTTGVTIVQSGVIDGDDGDDDVADTDTDGDGVDDADEPIIRGRVVLGSGADSLSILNGGLIGDVWFGDGADTLTLDGTGYMIGALHDSDGLLDIKVGYGSLGLTNTDTIKATSLSLGADSVMVFTVDPAAGTQTKLVVDTATIETGASLGLNFKSLLTTPTTYEVIQANTLTAGTIDQDLLGHVAYMYVANAYASGNAVDIDVRRRTAAEASLSRSQASAYDAVFAALSNDDDIASSASTTRCCPARARACSRRCRPCSSRSRRPPPTALTSATATDPTVSGCRRSTSWSVARTATPRARTPRPWAWWPATKRWATRAARWASPWPPSAWKSTTPSPSWARRPPPRSCRRGSTGGGRSGVGASTSGAAAATAASTATAAWSPPTSTATARPMSASPTPPPGTAWSPTPSPAWPTRRGSARSICGPRGGWTMCGCGRANGASTAAGRAST